MVDMLKSLTGIWPTRLDYVESDPAESRSSVTRFHVIRAGET